MMECHLPNYNFCGPFTNLRKRLNPDRTPKTWSKPINKIDEISMRHDIAYGGDRCAADEAMLRELWNLNDTELTSHELMTKYFVCCVIGLVYCVRKLYRRCCHDVK